MNSFIQLFFILLPKSIISRFVGLLSVLYIPEFLREFLFSLYIKAYQVEESEIELPLKSYHNFRCFFTRKLKYGSRQISKNKLISPVDGVVLSCGNYDNGTLIQIKGFTYSINDLLNHSVICNYFGDLGSYCTYYLAPGDYHRIHSPADGMIVSRLYVPGSLFPVNDFSRKNIPDLYVRNERLITLLDLGSSHFVAVVKVAALNVGKIGIAYDEVYLNDQQRYKQFLEPIPTSKGDDLGVFYLGSTVIVISNQINMFNNREFDRVKMGMGV